MYALRALVLRACLAGIEKGVASHVLRFLFGPRVMAIASSDLAHCLNEGPLPFLLDVRTLREYRRGSIPTAHWIPLGQLARRLVEIPPDRMVVTVCRSGHRGMMAARMLLKQGYEVKNLQGGMRSWAGPVTKD